MGRLIEIEIEIAIVWKTEIEIDTIIEKIENINNRWKKIEIVIFFRFLNLQEIIFVMVQNLTNFSYFLCTSP